MKKGGLTNRLWMLFAVLSAINILSFKLFLLGNTHVSIVTIVGGIIAEIMLFWMLVHDIPIWKSEGKWLGG